MLKGAVIELEVELETLLDEELLDEEEVSTDEEELPYVGGVYTGTETLVLVVNGVVAE